MPGYPFDATDRVHFQKEDHYLPEGGTVTLLNSKTIDIVGTVNINGSPVDGGGSFDIRSYGPVVANGDITVALNAASLAASLAGGGTVLIPRGTYDALNVIVYDNVHFIGQGVAATVLRLPNASNGQIFLTENWVTLQSGVTGGGPQNWSVESMTLDCNGANNSSGWGLLIYGKAFVLKNLHIRNHKSGALNSEWGTILGPNPMEAFVKDIICWTPYDAYGFFWNGPHDSHIENVSCISTAGSSTKQGFAMGAKSNGTALDRCHTWGTHQWGAIVDGPSVSFNQCFLEGGTTGQLLVRTTGVQYKDGLILGNQVNGVKGIELGVVAGAAATFCDIDTQVLYCRGGALSLQNQVSNSIKMHVTRDTVDPVVVGVASNTDWSLIDIQVEGTAGSDEYQNINRRVVVTNRSTPGVTAFTVKGHSAQTFPLISAQDSTAVQLFAVTANGTIFCARSAWNFNPLTLGTFVLWVDASGRLRIKNGNPSSDTDGTIVGTQT